VSHTTIITHHTRLHLALGIKGGFGSYKETKGEVLWMSEVYLFLILHFIVLDYILILLLVFLMLNRVYELD
jgi:hypothetical protein